MRPQTIKKDLPILVIEDSDVDFEAMNRLFRQLKLPNEIYRALDGDEALNMLFGRGDTRVPRPGLILLDVNLPGTDGWEVLRQIKLAPELRRIPVLIVTGSKHPEDIQNAYDRGASTFICKPEDASDYAPLVDLIRHYWFGNRFVYLA